MMLKSTSKWPLWALLSLLVPSGCANLSQQGTTVQPTDIIRVAQPDPAANAAENDEGTKADAEKSNVVVEQAGSDQLYNKAPRAVERADGDKLSVNFNDAPLMDIVHVVLGELLAVPYTVEGLPEGNMTLITDEPVPREVLFDLLEAMLETQGMAISKGDGGIYRIAPIDGIKAQLKLQSGGKAERGYSVRLVALNYISATEAMKFLQPMGVADSVIYQDPVRNLLVLGASAPKMNNILRTLDVFDVDVMKGMSFGVYEIFNYDVQEIYQRLEAMLATPEVSPVAGMVKLVPLTEINSIMVISARKHYLDTAREWIAKFDVAASSDGGAGEQMYVYKVQNGEALELSNLLNQLFQTGAETAVPSTLGSTAPGTEAREVGNKPPPAGRNQQRNAVAQSGETQGPGKLSRDTRIVPDEINNSLLIMATPTDWRSIRSALQRLDIVPLQVLVEVSIWEVTLQDNLRFGVEWYFEHSINNGKTVGLGTLDLDGGGINPVSGFSYLLTGNDWSAVVNTLDEQSRLEVLSSPSVLVLDNQTATINVGNQVPVSEGSSVTDGGTTIDRITYRDTGVSLTVTPRVNAGGLVIMEIEQEVTDVGNIDAATGQRTFLRRNINSTVAIQSGDSIVLGGLIQDNKSVGSSGIPWLHQVPVLGALFGSKSDDQNRTELLVTISPTAIGEYQDFQRIGNEIQNKMKNVMAAFQSGQATEQK